MAFKLTPDEFIGKKLTEDFSGRQSIAGKNHKDM